VRFVPLSERSRVNLDDGTLHKSVGSDEFVVGGVVDHSDDPRLPGDALGSPRKVARVQTKGTEFGVTTTGAHAVDALDAKLGVGGLTAEFELALLAVVGTLGTGSGTLMS